MEYMAYCVPIVSFDLIETRVSAGESAIYVESGDVDGFARAWSGLLDDRAERIRLGELARERVTSELDWAPQGAKYVDVWRRLLGDPAAGPAVGTRPEPAAPNGKEFVPLDDPESLASFIGDRGRAESSS
jgi:hypothetical protein